MDNCKLEHEPTKWDYIRSFIEVCEAQDNLEKEGEKLANMKVQISNEIDKFGIRSIDLWKILNK